MNQIWKKFCRKCKLLKPITDYRMKKNKIKDDYVYHTCKKCCSEKRSKQYQKNKKEINKKYKEYFKKRCEYDIVFKLKNVFRRNINYCLKKNGYTKKSRTYEIIGCSFEELKKYLENQFEPWMNWENKGLYNGSKNYGWDIDHIIPLSSSTTEEELIKLNHYTNLQPLCSYINRNIKRDKTTNQN